VALRFDSAPLSGLTRTPQGGLKVAARLARTGVQVYHLPDGSTRREYRSPAEVFAPEVLNALRDAPVTSRHPLAGEVRADNFQSLAVGHVSSDSVRAEEQTYIAANLIVQDATEIGRIERREHLEVSVGYDVTFVPGAGVSPEGEHYDGIQTQIRPNHVALVPRGRAGREVGLRLDSEGNEELSAPKKEVKRMKIMIDGKEYEHGSPEAIAAAADSKRRADAQDAEIAKFRKANSAALRATAKRVKVDVRADADDSTVMVEVVKKIAPDVDLASASPEFIAGAFAVAISIAMKSMDLESPAKESAEPPPAAGAAQVRADAVDGRREDAREVESYTAEDILRENLEQQRAAARAGL
jgi:uncharacterized protein